MQKQFGQSTEVILPNPNGNTINTTMLGSSRINLHTNNNRLGVSESTNIMYLPGMKSHQEPDFTNVSESVVVAAQQPTIADSFLSPLFSAAARGGAPAAAAAASTVSITPSTAASSQIERDRQFAIQLQSGEDTRARAEAAATPAQSQINVYAAMDNGGGKMGSQQQPCIYLDGREPTPPSTGVSHLTAGTATQAMGGRIMDAASSLLPSFNASASRNATERAAARTNNAMLSLDNMVTYNNKKMHNDKRKSELSTPEKEERNEAKMRKKKYLKPLQLADEKEVTAKMRQLVGPGEPTLSQTPLKSAPNTLLTRLKNAWSDDDSSSDEEE
jgi:hypothetical protein